jgi:hypothetical protein
MSNGKVCKLLRAYSRVTGRNSDEMKRWYNGLNWPQRAEANKVMREAIAPKQEVEKV